MESSSINQSVKLTIFDSFADVVTSCVFIAVLIAWPLVYVIMNKWFHTFPYHAEIDVWTFFISTVFIMLIALGTVTFQSIKTAMSNPVDSLRHE